MEKNKQPENFTDSLPLWSGLSNLMHGHARQTQLKTSSYITPEIEEIFEKLKEGGDYLNPATYLNGLDLPPSAQMSPSGSLLYLLLVYQRVTYFINQIDLGDIDNALKHILRSIFTQAVLMGWVFVTWDDSGHLACCTVSRYTKDVVEGQSVNIWGFTEGDPERITRKREEVLILEFNLLHLGLGAEGWAYLPDAPKFVQLISRQLTGKNKKLLVTLDTPDKNQLIDNFINDVMSQSPVLTSPEGATVSKLDLPDSDISELGTTFKDYINYFDDIIGIKILNSASDKTRDLQAEANQNIYKTEIIFNEWFENVAHFIEEFNEMTGENVQVGELVQLTNPVEKNEKEQYESEDALNAE